MIERSLVARAAQGLANAVSRRDFLDKGFRAAGGFVFMFLFGRSVAGATQCPGSGCLCAPPRGVFCSGCPSVFGPGCPNGCSICVSGDDPWCPYTSGWWIGGCPGSGATVVCVDCLCNGVPCGCCSRSSGPPPPLPDPPPCIAGPEILGTTTWMLGPSGRPTRGSAQLSYGLGPVAGRKPESAIYFEEWALLSVAGSWPAIENASSEQFRQKLLLESRVTNGAADLVPTGEDATVLLVQAADHPQDERHVPRPVMDPFRTRLSEPGVKRDQEFWFRAEVSETALVDSILLLGNYPQLPVEAVKKAIRDNLSLRYADQRRHRIVVYARGVVSEKDHLTVHSGFPTQPRCCECWGPEGPRIPWCDDCFPCDPCWPC